MESNRIRNIFGVVAAMAALVAIAVWSPPSEGADIPDLTAADVTTSRGAPVQAAEWSSLGTTALGTTPAFIFAADITTAQRRQDFVQNVRIVNRSASAFVCFKPILRTASGCSTDCSGSGVTCSGASTDGDPVLPSNSYSIAIDGNSCPCWVASAASTTANATRIARFPR